MLVTAEDIIGSLSTSSFEIVQRAKEAYKSSWMPTI